MRSRDRRRPGRYRSVPVLLTLAALGLAGCGSTATTTSAPTSTTTGSASGAGTTATTGPDYEIVSDADVKAGLADVRKVAAGIKATLATDRAAAEAQARAMYDRWFEFEGTVRKNDKNLYLQMEDGLAAIKAGAEQNRADKVDKGLKDLEAGATAYLVKFP